jgi:uncharacterized protein YjbI with pentapeptide repeats
MQIFNKEGVLLIDSDNLCGADLRGADLRGADLTDANLYGTNLTDANLYGANLTDANLYGADLCGADLYDADLRGANLHDVHLYATQLNWNSRELIAEILRQAAGFDLTKLGLAGIILLQTKWCWGDFMSVELPAKEWGLSVLAKWPDKGKPDCVPRNGT